MGIEAFDCYGITEIGPILATECNQKAGIHWIEDHLLVEVIDPETKKPCNLGESGVLVLTHLTKEATPLIRFWTGDITKLDKRKCKCGRTHARSPGGILGRVEDRVQINGNTFFPSQIENVVRGIDELSDEFYIELATDPKSGTDKCILMVECLRDEDVPKISSRLETELKNQFKFVPELKFVSPGTLKRTLFKSKRIIDRRTKE